MLISARCLLGKEVREKMLDEVFSTFHDLTDNSLRLTSLLFPYAPLPTTRRRDRARARLSRLFTEVVRSRRSSNQSSRQDDDVLQNLIDSRYKDGRRTTDAEVTGLVIAILFAGNEAHELQHQHMDRSSPAEPQAVPGGCHRGAAAGSEETRGAPRLQHPPDATTTFRTFTGILMCSTRTGSVRGGRRTELVVASSVTRRSVAEGTLALEKRMPTCR